MGMENYFILILPDGVTHTKEDGCNILKGHGSIKYLKFFEEFKTDAKMRNISEKSIVIDDAIILTIDSQESYIRSIIIEGCFAWYHDGLKLCYKILKVICDIIGDITVIHPKDLNLKSQNENDFIQKIIEYYEPKYNAFVKQFGDIKAKVLPGNAFYDLYEEFKRKNRV